MGDKNIRLLDCIFRDEGYCTKWYFDDEYSFIKSIFYVISKDFK